MKLKTIGAALILTLATGMLAACGSSGTPAPTQTTLRIGLDSPPTPFDPLGFIGGFAAQAVYDGLLDVEPDVDNPKPWLAKSFSYNNDHTVLTLQIRDNVNFSDGSHLDATVVKDNLDAQRGPDGANASYFAAITDVVATGKYTVEIRLSHPDSSLMLVMNKGITSETGLKDHKALAEKPIGTGPYTIQSHQSDTEYTFVRNKKYWNPSAYPFDKIEMKVMPDVTARLNALKSGQIDFAPIMVATAPEAKASGLNYFTVKGQWTGLMLDRSGARLKALGDLRVRQAIQMSLDRDGYNKAADGGLGDPSNQIGVPAQAKTGYYLPSLADKLPYDVKAAKKLMADAGYADGFDVTIPVTPGLEQIDPYIKQALGEIGIRVTWQPSKADTWSDSVFTPGTYPIYPMSGNYNEPSFITKDGLLNPWHLSDTQSVELLNTLASSSGAKWLDARKQLTKKIFDESWFAILGHEPLVYGFDSSLRVQSPLWVTLHNIGRA